MPYPFDVNQVILIAEQAAITIMRYYNTEVSIGQKEDFSPVTDADLAANELINKELRKLTPEIPIISEENKEEENLQAACHSAFWLVDPLDGTKSFIRKSGDFTVNIAYVDGGKALWGCIVLPVSGTVYAVDDKGEGVRSRIGNTDYIPIRTRTMPNTGAVVVASHSHRSPQTEAYIRSIHCAKLFSRASSLKLCVLAEGDADIYPRFGPTSVWDIAAGHAILKAAGGNVYTLDRKELTYGRGKTLLNPDFIALGDVGKIDLVKNG